MTIRELVEQGLYYARTCRSLWLFGFFVGIASGGSNGGGGGEGSRGDGGAAGGGLGGGFFALSVNEIVAIAIVIVLAIVVFTVLRFVGEGALIEGVVRARQGGTMTTREGFRAGRIGSCSCGSRCSMSASRSGAWRCSWRCV